MLQVTQVEHADRAISADRGKDVFSAACFTEGNVVHFLVVGNQLRLNVARQASSADDLASFNAPDGAGGVDARGAQNV